MKMNSPLRLAFAAVAAVAAGAGMMALTDDPAEKSWQAMLARDSVIFSPNYRHQGAPRPAGEHAMAVQIESSRGVASGLLLKAGSDPKEILDDHVGAAAAIMDETADRMSGRDVPVAALSRPQPMSEWFWDGKSRHVRALFGHADVLSLSMGTRYDGDQSTSCADGSLQTLRDARMADELWRRSRTIMVQSVGNEGNDGRGELQRNDPSMTMRGDTFLYIGEADRDSEQAVYVAGHSSRGGTSVVVTNPFRNGFGYRYYGTRTADQLRRQLENFYNGHDPVTGKLNRDIFAERLALPVHGDDDIYKLVKKPGQTAPCRVINQDKRPALTSVHPAFTSVSFPGKENLTKPREWQAAHAGEVLEAFINGLVAAQEFNQSGGFNKMSPEGFVYGLWGTSYAAPHAGGMIAAMREKHPLLSEYDLNAAALMAAVPVDKVETDAVNAEGTAVYRTITYRNNGRGLPHNSYEAGFGFLDEGAYAAMTARMAALLEKNPALATREDSARSAMTSFAANGGTEYKLHVNRDIVALRANLTLKFAGGNAGVPVSITLVSPAGGEVEISPSKPLSGGPAYSFASTDGHFGNHTGGTWTIRVPAGVKLEQAQLTIPGAAKGGLIDQMLDEVAGPKRDVAAVRTLMPGPA